MAKLVLDDIGSTLTNTAATTINNNNAKIEQALENTLSRDGSIPNQMNADIDLNSNDLLNVKQIDAETFTLNGTPIIPGGAVPIPPNSVGTTQIVDGAITEPKLNASVTGQLVAKTTNRTTLKALDTDRYQAAFLYESGREGLFKWTVGDFSAQITSDTREGVYIKANALASTAGAWVRQEKDSPNPKWFGAVGDGVTDDTIALNAWADYISSGSLALGLGIKSTPPSGRYLISDTVTFKFGANVEGPEGSARYGFQFVVDSANWSGANVAVLIQAETEAFTSAKITGISVDCNGTSGVQGIRFEGAYQNSQLSNIWILDTASNVKGLVVKPLDRVGAVAVCESVLLENIYVIPAAAVGTITQPAIELDRCQETTLINVKGFGKLPGDAATPGAAGIKVLDSRGVNLIGCSAAFSKYGIEVEALTRQTTGVTIVGPIYEGVVDFSLYLHGTVTNKVTNVTQIGTRIETPAATSGLDANHVDFAVIDTAFQNSTLAADVTSVTIQGFGVVTAASGAKYVQVVSPNAVKDKYQIRSVVTAVKDNSPSFDLEVDTRAGQYRWQWSASSSVDNGARFQNPAGNTLMSMGETAGTGVARLGFYGVAHIQRPTVVAAATDAATTQTLANSLRTQLIALGLVQ